MSLPNLHGMRMHAAITMVGSGYKRKIYFDDRPNQVHPFPSLKGNGNQWLETLFVNDAVRKWGEFTK